MLAASITLGVLIFLMSGTGGMFTHKISLKSYFDDAQGLVQVTGAGLAAGQEVVVPAT